MDQPSSVAPNADAPQPAGQRAAKRAAEQAAPEISELAFVPLAELMQRLHSADTGLGAAEAATLLETVGPNRIDTAKQKRFVVALLERLGNPLVLILLFAATVSALTGDVASFVVIAAIVVMSVILDVTQERQAQNAAERLRQRVSLSVTILRDGRHSILPRRRSSPAMSFFSPQAISSPPIRG